MEASGLVQMVFDNHSMDFLLFNTKTVKIFGQRIIEKFNVRAMLIIANYYFDELKRHGINLNKMNKEYTLLHS